MKRIPVKRVMNVVALAGLVSAAGLALPALAHPGPGHGPHGRHGHGMERLHGMLMHMAGELELTEAQRDEIRAIVEASRSGALGEEAAALHEAKRRLGTVIHDVDAADQQIIDASRAVAEVEERLALERHRMFVAIHGVLTPEQQERAKELHAERPKGPGGFGAKRRGPRIDG